MIQNFHLTNYKCRTSHVVIDTKRNDELILVVLNNEKSHRNYSRFSRADIQLYLKVVENIIPHHQHIMIINRHL